MEKKHAMIKQYLPTYIRNLLEEKSWRVRESTHYRFHFFPESVAEQEIESIITRQEMGYKKIIDFLSISEPNHPIEYYLYPDEKTKKELMGDDWYAQAIYNEFRVHLLYTEKIKPLGEHEDTHLLSLSWGLTVGFFQEGLAEYLTGQAWDGKTHLEYTHEGYNKNIYPPLVNFMDHQAWLETDDTQAIYFYSLAGAFVSFLITSFGKDLFESFYHQLNRDNTKKNNEKSFESVYGRKIEDIEIEFLKKI